MVMDTIASQLKALSQNTPQSSIILLLGYLQVPECYQVENIIATCHYSIHILFISKFTTFLSNDIFSLITQVMVTAGSELL